ncbi:MAG: phospholactate guanylyltransferase [Actinomycetia bacterium]|nr:phospholactate guanylyltransferase [Actinomycetes bacterium]
MVPIRAFSLGKARLAEVLDAAQRAELARSMAERVVRAAGRMPLVVVSGAAEVRAWCAARSIAVIDDPGSLDAAARAGLVRLAADGCVRAVVVHSDLPHVEDLASVVRDGSLPIATVVPCHRDDGTPVLSVPVDAGFEFHYGEGSFLRHLAECRRVGLAIRVVRDPRLRFDVDTPDDLLALGAGWPLVPAGAS